MPCHAAMIANPPCARVDQSVDEVLTLMKVHNLSCIPVVEKTNVLAGLFSYKILLKNILPVSVSLAGGGHVDMTVRAAPGIAKRLKKIGPLSINHIMKRKVRRVYPDTPTWEGVCHLIEHDEPLMVVERETGALLGMIVGASALQELQRLRDE